jgi:hypothetical protein
MIDAQPVTAPQPAPVIKSTIKKPGDMKSEKLIEVSILFHDQLIHLVSCANVCFPCMYIIASLAVLRNYVCCAIISKVPNYPLQQTYWRRKSTGSYACFWIWRWNAAGVGPWQASQPPRQYKLIIRVIRLAGVEFVITRPWPLPPQHRLFATAVVDIWPETRWVNKGNQCLGVIRAFCCHHKPYKY